jgi:exodeoxyribonuclease VII large subunit
MNDALNVTPSKRLPAQVWQVGALCRAIADALDARFNPVTVRGEISGFSRASSGHCYFSLKDASGQIRCAMFKRAASMADFMPRDGDLVEVRGRIDVYTPRGDLQLIVESISQAGQGALFEQFLRLKAKLEAEGLFEQSRKRPLPLMPRKIGVVTSLGAAALHDVATALQRRVPHIPVVLSPASVQGVNAPQEIIKSLSKLYLLRQQKQGLQPDLLSNLQEESDAEIDVILLVRGGGSLEDLWAFNDEALARAIASSPIPIIVGVGHETDFSIADFVADVRAPTPTAAAELVSASQQTWLNTLDLMQDRLQSNVNRYIDSQNQRLDRAQARLGRPSNWLAQQRQQLLSHSQHLKFAVKGQIASQHQQVTSLQKQWPNQLKTTLSKMQERLARSERGLALLDPNLVLQRGYAWLIDELGATVVNAAQVQSGQALRATLAKGQIDLTVQPSSATRHR